MNEKKTGRGGKRPGAGRPATPYATRSYRIPLAYKEECIAEIKETLAKYRQKCKTFR